MKKSNVFSLAAACMALSLAACNNSGDGTTSSSDSSSSSTTNTVVSTNNYAARADTVKANVTAGNYLNPSTGRAYTTLTVDPTTGALTDESGHRVRRYVDKRSWHVYDTQSWDTVGSAEMHNGTLMYRGDNGDWETYDKRWHDDMDTSSMGTSGTMNSSGDGTMVDSSSTMSGSGSKNPKVKVSDNGNKVKIKNH